MSTRYFRVCLVVFAPFWLLVAFFVALWNAGLAFWESVVDTVMLVQDSWNEK